MLVMRPDVGLVPDADARRSGRASYPSGVNCSRWLILGASCEVRGLLGLARWWAK